MRKGSWTSHPLFGMGIGFLIPVGYIAFENAISPAATALLGEWWVWLKFVLYFFLLGVGAKFFVWRSIPNAFFIEPMTPAEFAGVSAEEAQQALTKIASPLPEVPDGPEPKKPSSLPLEFAQIEARTRELEALGFVLQIEGVARTNLKNAAPIFARMMCHPDGAWGEVYQAFPRGLAPMPVTLTLVTYFEDDWVFASSTMKTNWALWMLRRPRALGKRHEPTESAAAILTQHKATCERIAATLQARPLVFSLDDCYESGVRGLNQSRPLFLRRSILLSMLQIKLRAGQTEWWGDYDKYVSREA